MPEMRSQKRRSRDEPVSAKGRRNGSIPPNNLQRLRERHKRDGGFYLTLAEMARLMGFSEGHVSYQENAKRPLTDQDVIDYARILKVNPVKIFPGLTVSDSRQTR